MDFLSNRNGFCNVKTTILLLIFTNTESIFKLSNDITATYDSAFIRHLDYVSFHVSLLFIYFTFSPFNNGAWHCSPADKEMLHTNIQWKRHSNRNTIFVSFLRTICHIHTDFFFFSQIFTNSKKMPGCHVFRSTTMAAVVSLIVSVVKRKSYADCM